MVHKDGMNMLKSYKYDYDLQYACQKVFVIIFQSPIIVEKSIQGMHRNPCPLLVQVQ
jgi:hypothetical protein